MKGARDIVTSVVPVRAVEIYKCGVTSIVPARRNQAVLAALRVERTQSRHDLRKPRHGRPRLAGHLPNICVGAELRMKRVYIGEPGRCVDEWIAKTEQTYPDRPAIVLQ